MSDHLAAVIVGASKGIGLALAHEFAAQGHDVLMIARDGARLEAAAASIGNAHAVRVMSLAVDITHADAASRIDEAIRTHRLDVGYLVCNAGAWQAGSFHEVEPAAVERLLAVNILAHQALVRGLAPLLIAKGGGVLFVGSLAGMVPTPAFSSYGASKAFLHSAALAMREEVWQTGLTVSVLAPGIVATDFAAVPGTRWKWLGDLAATSPATVARAGYRGLMSRTPIIVPGLPWRLLWIGMGAVPAGLLPRLAGAALWSRLLLAPVKQLATMLSPPADAPPDAPCDAHPSHGLDPTARRQLVPSITARLSRLDDSSLSRVSSWVLRIAYCSSSASRSRAAFPAGRAGTFGGTAACA